MTSILSQEKKKKKHTHIQYAWKGIIKTKPCCLTKKKKKKPDIDIKKPPPKKKLNRNRNEILKPLNGLKHKKHNSVVTTKIL